jgi:hypothetical protein
MMSEEETWKTYKKLLQKGVQVNEAHQFTLSIYTADRPIVV